MRGLFHAEKWGLFARNLHPCRAKNAKQNG